MISFQTKFERSILITAFALSRWHISTILELGLRILQEEKSIQTSLFSAIIITILQPSASKNLWKREWKTFLDLRLAVFYPNFMLLTRRAKRILRWWMNVTQICKVGLGGFIQSKRMGLCQDTYNLKTICTAFFMISTVK